MISKTFLIISFLLVSLMLFSQCAFSISWVLSGSHLSQIENIDLTNKTSENNESNVWAFFIDKELLYSTDPSETIKYLGEAPFTTGFSKESPGRTGWWMGWQIVRSYMNNYPETTVLELMKLDNNQDILTKSKYKPRR